MSLVNKFVDPTATIISSGITSRKLDGAAKKFGDWKHGNREKINKTKFEEQRKTE